MSEEFIRMVWDHIRKTYINSGRVFELDGTWYLVEDGKLDPQLTISPDSIEGELAFYTFDTDTVDSIEEINSNIDVQEQAESNTSDLEQDELNTTEVVIQLKEDYTEMRSQITLWDRRFPKTKYVSNIKDASASDTLADMTSAMKSGKNISFQTKEGVLLMLPEDQHRHLMCTVREIAPNAIMEIIRNNKNRILQVIGSVVLVSLGYTLATVL